LLQYLCVPRSSLELETHAWDDAVHQCTAQAIALQALGITLSPTFLHLADEAIK